MTISFRTRLFVIAALIVTTVITAVMLIGWSRVLAFEATRLEQRLCLEARRLATQPMRSEDVPLLVSDVLGKLHLNSANQVMLHFESRQTGQGWSSVNWQSEFLLVDTLWRDAANAAEHATQASTSDNRPHSPRARLPFGTQDEQSEPPPPNAIHHRGHLQSPPASAHTPRY